MSERLRPSEYGGSDTQKTMGIQPAPHALRAEEKLRVVYASDPLEPELLPLETGPLDG